MGLKNISTGGGGGDFPVLEEDLYPGRIAGVIDIGTQETLYGLKPQIIILFELTGQLVDGLPYQKSKWYTASLHEKASFRKDIELIMGKMPDEVLSNFDASKLINAPCMIALSKTKNDKGYDQNKIEAVSRVPKGMDVPPLVNDPIYFDLDDPSWRFKLEQLPEWLQEKVNQDDGAAATKSVAGAAQGEPEIPGYEEEDNSSW